MPTILLIRHGENEYINKGRLAGRIPGVHLNENGRTQVEALVKTLAGISIQAVYASPLERTMETAEPLAHELGLEVIPRPGLLEIDFGEWENQTLKQLRRRKLWRILHQRPSLVRFPNGETFAEAQGRIISEIETLCVQHKPKDMIVCVSHSDTIKLAVAYYLGLPLDMFRRLTIAPASITTLHISDGNARLININHAVNFSLHKPMTKPKT